MKTSILQLEVHDDFLSVRDRLNWVKGGRVLLVWPKRPRSLERRLDIVLILHACNSLGLQLGLVTKDPDVRLNAEDLGIPVFDSTRQAQSERWARRHKPKPRPERQHPRPDLSEMRRQLMRQPARWTLHFLIRGALFTLAIFSVLAIALLLLPEAQITLIPKTETQSLVLDVSASPSAQVVTLAGALPARPVNVIVDGYATITATGTITVPASFAGGSVQFTNLSDKAITIPAGSIVSTSDKPAVRFATRQEGKVTAGPGNSAIVPVDSLMPGSAGNLPANKIVTLEGPLSFALAVTNPTEIRGGSNVSVAAPSPADRDRLYHQLISQLQRSATEALQASLLPGDQLISSAVLTDTIEKIYEPDTPQPATQLALTLRLQFSGLAVSAKEMQQWATAMLDANLPAGYLPIPNSLVIEQLTMPSQTTNQPANWQIEVQRDLQALISPSEAATLTRWRPASEAARSLTNLPLAEPPAIEISPSWWPFIPLRVQVHGGS